MATYRINKNKDNPYVVLNNQFLRRSDLSMKAKGLLVYFLSLPNDWKIVRKELPSHFSDKITSITNVIKELKVKGYVVRHQKRTKSQKIWRSYLRCL